LPRGEECSSYQLAKEISLSLSLSVRRFSKFARVFFILLRFFFSVFFGQSEFGCLGFH